MVALRAEGRDKRRWLTERLCPPLEFLVLDTDDKSNSRPALTETEKRSALAALVGMLTDVAEVLHC